MNAASKRLLTIAALLLAALALSGCAAMNVQPWDRDLLSKPTMSLNAQPRLNEVDDHIYFSKEGSTGGMDVAGGGCGCN